MSFLVTTVSDHGLRATDNEVTDQNGQNGRNVQMCYFGPNWSGPWSESDGLEGPEQN